MRKFLLPATAALIALSSAVALAATANGTIKSMDQQAHTITLADGKVYHLPASFNWASLKVGEKVNVTFTASGNMNNASAVAAAS